MVGAPPPSGGYRDERDAALAQIESLRKQVAIIEPEVQRLRAENDMLRRELSRYTGQSYTQPRSSAGAIIPIAALVFMFLAGVATFVLFRAEPSGRTLPSSVEMPSSVSSTPMPEPQPIPVPVSATPTPVDPSRALTGT